MGFYTVILANKEQQEVLLTKHLKAKPVSLIKKALGYNSNAILERVFSYDSEDNIGFVTLKLATLKTCSYQLRNNEPCFVEFTGFGQSIRYDIPYPEGEMYSILREEGVKAQVNFWKGGAI